MPESFRASILASLSAADAVLLSLDLAPTVVSIITRRWSGGRPMTGTYGDSVLNLPRWLCVEEISNREVAQSGGTFVTGDLRIGPIRPSWNSGCSGISQSGGFTEEQLRPTVNDESVQIIYRMTQAHGLGTGWSGDYDVVELNRDEPLEFYLIVRRLMESQQTNLPLAP
jgi:hypothetical protein